jgi:hypothetical protein
MTTEKMLSFSVFVVSLANVRVGAVGRRGELLNPKTGKMRLPRTKEVIRGEAARTGSQQGFCGIECAERKFSLLAPPDVLCKASFTASPLF